LGINVKTKSNKVVLYALKQKKQEQVGPTISAKCFFMKEKSIIERTDSNDHKPIIDLAGPTIPAELIIPKIRLEPEKKGVNLPEILVITSYPPRECGVATYSRDLVKAINNKFSSSFNMSICALESGEDNYPYSKDVKYILNTTKASGYEDLIHNINNNDRIEIVVIQHEFGFFKEQEQMFIKLIRETNKPVIVAFHTVLPHPDNRLKMYVKRIAKLCESVIVMTHNSEGILSTDYEIPQKKLIVIAHGTHLVPHLNNDFLKRKYGLDGKRVLTTFGLLSSGKSIETTLNALPAIIKSNPDVIFLIIGKTHPEVVKTDGEKYRKMLEQITKDYSLQNHVKFVNDFLELPELLEYLQLTDIYLFTSNNPKQAVSGTFVYAMSCACPIISTPIPHTREVLTEDVGITFDFNHSQQLSNAVIKLLNDEPLRRNMGSNTLQKSGSTSWENSAVAHSLLFKKIAGHPISMRYNLPAIKFSHLKLLTTRMGMIQFSKINQPDIDTGYTLDDNARALIATCMYFKISGDKRSLYFINIYLCFIKFCQQTAGNFLNYVDKEIKFTSQNDEANLDDSSGRAMWALGYVVSLAGILPSEMVSDAMRIFKKALVGMAEIHSPRAMAFTIKGIYHYHKTNNFDENITLLEVFANRLTNMYRHECDEGWNWFESYLTYANSTLPEAMLYAWKLTGKEIYRDTALDSFNFLLSHTFNANGIEVISNRNWMHKNREVARYGEQPIDVAYTIMTLSEFYDTFMDGMYYEKMEVAFSWFLGQNRLHQIIYNPCTGGCYDGLEESHANLNQGAESTISYLMARLTVAKYHKESSQFTF